MKNTVVYLLLLFYIYCLFKIVVLKFGPFHIETLLDNLQRNTANPDYLLYALHSGNLVPLREITRALTALTKHTLLNLFGNIVIFIPFGVFLGTLMKSKILQFLRVFILSFGLSLSLESAQLFFSMGTFDVDDLILNTVGGLIGFVFYVLISRLLKDRKKVS
ncbi:VanZ family protein [Aureibacillus halotolerans]|uniref:VanZ like protein n=1 Tax=Aureibacillus halotolerans TaxID=1508390 RepID=A0A4R6U1S6_9BACI|nr:VanZ family protein [Aureibacillus halotolerans]TDQ40358.1 VanZ like protein [Aureibacillus halotolerans]